MKASQCPGGLTLSGLCPGTWATRCCLSAPYQEAECSRRGGVCMDECACSQASGGGSLYGLCPDQPEAVRCCTGEVVTER